jgi:hypothetical protein
MDFFSISFQNMMLDKGLLPKIQQTKMLVTCQGLVIGFYLGWSGSTLLITKHIIKVGTNS